MPAVVVMQSMAFGVGDDDKEENSFSDWLHRQPKKAKPTTAAMAFCVYINP